MARRKAGGGYTGPGPIEIGLHRITVQVDLEGTFWAEFEGDIYRSNTYLGLRAKLLPVARVDAKRCSVPAFFRSYGNDFTFVTLIGLHGGNGNILYVDSDGKTHQDGGRVPRFYRVLTEAELKECKRLEAAIKAAQRKLSAWLKTHAIHAGNTIRKAIGVRPEKVDRIDDDDYN